MAFTILGYEKAEGVATITLNRPDKSNAFDDVMSAEMLDALKNVERDDQVRCVVITGAGKNFCAGQDLSAFVGRYEQPDGAGFREHLQKGYNQMVARIRSMDKPVIAAINGAVAGAGLGLACACDLRHASENARFRSAFIGIGLAPDSALSFLLPRIIGFGRALGMALTNEVVDAQAALSYGLVTRVLPADELMPKTMEFARQLAQAPTRGMGLTKRDFNRSLYTDLEGALDYEAYIQEVAGHTQDHLEGVKAFLEKRPPKYYGK
ncbi:MAG: enoyl-CoA hydratase-related protein [Anaerolineae bacterium]